MVGLFAGTLSLLSMAALNNDFKSLEFISCIPLPIAVFFWYRNCINVYMLPSQEMRYEDAVQVDREVPDKWFEFDARAAERPLYRDPAEMEENPLELGISLQHVPPP